MSKDFVVFDPKGLAMPSDKESLLDWIHANVGEGTLSQQETATGSITKLLGWAAEKHGTKVGEEAAWAAWPPSLTSEGRHCTFHLCPWADAMSFTMDLTAACKEYGLIMIDPSGREPFMTIPGGGGLLD